MTEQRPRLVPGLVLAHVSLRVILPLLGGAIAGMVADGIGKTSPQFVLIGLVVGTIVSVLWLRAYVVSGLRSLRSGQGRHAGDGAEQDEQSTTGRT